MESNLPGVVDTVEAVSDDASMGSGLECRSGDYDGGRYGEFHD